jgi:integrase
VWRGNTWEGWYLVSTKTERGRRQIQIPKSLCISLLQLKERQEKRIAKCGNRYSDNGFVFANRWGRPYFRRSFIRTFKEALARAELPKKIRFYDLRHTTAILLLLLGINIKVVSERLGHASIAVTLEAYIHVLPEMSRGTGERLQAFLDSDRGKP